MVDDAERVAHASPQDAPSGSRTRDLSIPASILVFFLLGGLLFMASGDSEPCEDGLLRECTIIHEEAWRSQRSLDSIVHIERACPWFAPACQLLTEIADDLRHGRGVPADPVRAHSLYELSCKADRLQACVGLGRLQLELDGIEGRESAHAAFKRACVGRHAPGCEALAALERAHPSTATQ